jgi:predicted transcriptional regulator
MDMQEKLFDSEIKIMEIIWEKGPVSAKEISLIAADSIGWNKNTTYTVIKKLEAKGFIRRDEPGFICTALVTQSEVRKHEAESLLKKIFGGSRKALFSALLEDEEISESEAEELRKLLKGTYKDRKYTVV